MGFFPEKSGLLKKLDIRFRGYDELKGLGESPGVMTIGTGNSLLRTLGRDPMNDP
jgi:hypothetical protein